MVYEATSEAVVYLFAGYDQKPDYAQTGNTAQLSPAAEDVQLSNHDR